MKPYEKYLPSGVEWIGDIPEGWEVKKLKYIVSVNDGTIPETTPNDYEFKYVDIGSVTFEDGITEYQEMIFEEAPSRARRIVKRGDTIVSTVRTYLKAIAPIVEDKDIVVSTGFAVIRPKAINANFLSYFAKSTVFVDTVSANSVGVSYPAINPTGIVSIHCVYPENINEQDAIANYLDRETARIGNIIKAKEMLIDRLKEKRTAVITHAVTKGLDPKAKMMPSGVEWIGDIPEGWEVKKLKTVTNKIQDIDHYMPETLDNGVPYLMTGDLKEVASSIDFENCKHISNDDFVLLSKKGIPNKGDIIFARYATIGTVCLVDIDKEFLVSYSCVTIKTSSKLEGKYLFYYLKSLPFFYEITRACLKTQVVCATSTKSLQMQGRQSSKSCVKAYHNV